MWFGRHCSSCVREEACGRLRCCKCPWRPSSRHSGDTIFLNLRGVAVLRSDGMQPSIEFRIKFRIKTGSPSCPLAMNGRRLRYPHLKSGTPAWSLVAIGRTSVSSVRKRSSARKSKQSAELVRRLRAVTGILVYALQVRPRTSGQPGKFPPCHPAEPTHHEARVDHRMTRWHGPTVGERGLAGSQRIAAAKCGPEDARRSRTTPAKAG